MTNPNTAAAVPLRPLAAVYSHCKRVYHPLAKQGKWTEEEDKKLLACDFFYKSTGPPLGLTYTIEPLMELVTIGKGSQRTLGDLQQTAVIGTRIILVSGIREILVRLVLLFAWFALLIWLWLVDRSLDRGRSGRAHQGRSRGARRSAQGQRRQRRHFMEYC
jgi:hypothetical protein